MTTNVVIRKDNRAHERKSKTRKQKKYEGGRRKRDRYSVFPAGSRIPLAEDIDTLTQAHRLVESNPGWILVTE